MLRSSIAVLAFAAAAAAIAVNQAPPVPLDAQIGLLAFPVTCSLLGINQTFNTVFSATAPTTYGAGQQIYYTDTVGTIDIPKNVVAFAKALEPTATKAKAEVNVSLHITNASPSNPQVFSAVLTEIPLDDGEDSVFRVPSGNGTLPPIGPITLGVAKKSSRISLGNIDATLTLQNEDCEDILGPLALTCGPQNVEFIIGSVNVDNSTGPPFSPSNGYLPSYPPTPNLFEYGFLRFNYECTFGGAPQTLDLTVGGKLPVFFSPGEEAYFSDSNAFLRLPPSLLALARSVPNATTIVSTITDFDLLLTNASPAQYNAASKPIISRIDLSKDDSVLPVPETGVLTVGPITAGPDGSIVGIAVGNATATTEVLDQHGNVILTLPVSCYPPAPLELIGIPVSSVAPGNYSLGTNNAS